MTVLQEWETRDVVPAECFRCEEEFFIPPEHRQKLKYCPYCGNELTELGGDGIGLQGRTFEVSAP